MARKPKAAMRPHDHFINALDVRQYVLAGNATFTIKSEMTGTHYTFRVRQAEDDKGKPTALWFVQMLTGPDNESDYHYMGIFAGKDEDFRLTQKSRYTEESVPVKAMRYFWRHIQKGHLPPHCTVRHEGACGRCGRKLTVPESIDSGLGPDCRRQMGLAA